MVGGLCFWAASVARGAMFSIRLGLVGGGLVGRGVGSGTWAIWVAIAAEVGSGVSACPEQAGGSQKGCHGD